MKNLFSGRTRFPFHWLVVLIFALSSCSSFNVEKIKPSKNLEIGDETVVATQTIPSSGGTVIVDSPGNEIDGLEIVVPPQSYSTSKTFTISTTPITSHKLGEYFNPLTPLIQIENGGEYSDSIMEITIPITLPNGDIPLGFYYDEITGTLEAIPVKDYTSTSITLLTRHFMSASDLTPANETTKSAGINIDATANLVISSLSESILKATPIISSGFNVGIDDWEFPNYGSYIAIGGHCGGQTLTAMWYYFEKKIKGGNKLFEKFSTVPSLWQDNALGYRFSSVIQGDYQVDGEVFTFFDKYIDKNQDLDLLKYYSIAGAMLITGEPQGIAVFMQNGTNPDGTPFYDGHALICYQVAFNEGILYISDPNKPGIEQSIEFKNNKFEPYIAQINGNADSYPYPFITWYAKTAWIEWDQFGKRYSELLDSTIGNIAPNNFPAYTIWVKGKTDADLKNGFTSNSDTLRCMVECPTADYVFNVNGKRFIRFSIFEEDGTQIDHWEDNGKGYTILKPGLNKIGVYVFARKQGVVDKNGNLRDLFIDFKWFNVNYSQLEILPNPITGAPNDEITITASTGGTAPNNAKYVWNFGDGSSEVTVKNDSIVTHKFSKEGDYTLSVKLYDNADNRLVGQATATANIGAGILHNLQNMNYVIITLRVDITTNQQNQSWVNIDNAPLPPYTDKPKACQLIWDGSSFSATYDYKGDTEKSGTISGTMSADGLTVETITCSQKQVYTTVITYQDISANNIPYYSADDHYDIEGISVGQHITSVSYWMDSSWFPTYDYSPSINYTNESFILIDFRKETDY
jgi:hypothetical protein